LGEIHINRVELLDGGQAFGTVGADERALRAEGMTPRALADATWRDQMKATGEAPTQAFAARLLAAGYHGLLVRSFARGASDDDLNLVLWRWGAAAPCRLTLIDDEDRLSR
jgi:RES domain-containing protein